MPKRTILLVDDSEDIRTVISLGLELLGYQVLTAADAPSALTALQSQPVDFVILDHGLPGESGLNFGTKVLQQAEFANLLIVLFTGTQDQELEQQAKSAGFADCWIKPVGIHVMGKKIEALLEKTSES